jgi:hypothetical protein
VIPPTFSTPQPAASSNTCAKNAPNSAAFYRRNVHNVSWSGWVSAHNKRTATFS